MGHNQLWQSLGCDQFAEKGILQDRVHRFRVDRVFAVWLALFQCAVARFFQPIGLQDRYEWPQGLQVGSRDHQDNQPCRQLRIALQG